jgi:hypothetical protein
VYLQLARKTKTTAAAAEARPVWSVRRSSSSLRASLPRSSNQQERRERVPALRVGTRGARVVLHRNARIRLFFPRSLCAQRRAQARAQ